MKNKKNNQSIIYVNFAPYENAGRIFDFILENFFIVILFSFDFHKLNNKSQSNQMKVFLNGKIVQEKKLFKLPTPEFLLFVTLPIIALLIGMQTVWQLFLLREKYGKFDLYLTVNAFTAWIGNSIRKVGIVDKTIFWVWDYYPPGYPDLRIRLARWAYWKFDTKGTNSSNSVIFLNRRLALLRKEIGVLPKTKHFKTVPIGTNPSFIRENDTSTIGHLGVLKKSQGLDLLFDNFEQICKDLPSIKVEIIGSGPDEDHFRKRAKKFKQIKFFGFIKSEDSVDKIMKNWSIGLATYIPEKSNESYWTDPSKIKAYLSQSIPVITTYISGFSTEIKTAKAGIVIDYYDSDSFIEALKLLLKRQEFYKKNAHKLAKKYYYKKIYTKLFSLDT